MISYGFIKRAAFRAGFDLCGIARSRPLGEQTPRLEWWLGCGFDSGLEYMRRNVAKRTDPAALVAGAQTVVVCAVNYKNRAWDQTANRGPKIASYAYAPDYHDTIRAMLRQVFDAVCAEYPEVGGRCFVDTAPILEKAWAEEAGLGWRGRNSLIVTPQFGSFVLLGEIVFDAPCDDCDRPVAENGCGSCTLCVDSCPNGAITPDRMIDTSRCISRMTIERMSADAPVTPDGLHGWIFGCDECQTCCPRNAQTPLYTNPAFTPVVDPVCADAAFWRGLSREDFDRIFALTPLARTGYDLLRSRIE